MPGFAFANKLGNPSGVPTVLPYVLADNLSGTGTPPAANLNYGDLIVLTTKSTLTANSVPVARMLLAADVTASYEEGGNICGVLGVMITSQTSTSATGVAGASSNAYPGGTIYPLPNDSARYPAYIQASGRSVLRVAVASDNVFVAALYTGGGSVTLGDQYNNTLAGLNLSTTSGVTTYTVNTGAAVKCLTIIGPVIDQPGYNTLVAQNAAGPLVYVKFLGAYAQNLIGYNYSSQ
jgi:hypothetical protein